MCLLFINFLSEYVHRNAKKIELFSDYNLSAATQPVDNGMSKKAAAKPFGISQSTLQFWMRNRDE